MTAHQPIPAPLRWLAFAAAVSTVGLIALGGLLTSKGAGMSVPDWPTTYGYNMFFFPIEQWTGGILYEHTHRLVASVVGLLTAIFAGWIWIRENQGMARWVGLGAVVATLGLMGVRTQTMFLVLAGLAAVTAIYSAGQLRNDSRPVRWWAAIAFCVVLIQGVLGGVRVTAMKDEIGIFHGTLAQLFLVLVSAIAFSMTALWDRVRAQGRGSAWANFRAPLTVLAVLVLMQLMLGATMRHEHAGLAIPDFPLAHGKLWPATDPASIERYNQQRLDVIEFNAITASHIYVHMAHRLGAVVLLCGAIWLALRTRGTVVGKFALGWLALVLCQATLGAFTVLTNKAADIATLHQFFGAMTLVSVALGAVAGHRAAGLLAVNRVVDVAEALPADSRAAGVSGAT
jgi:cytochrome c oxidase assembly protein subunit 15